MPQTDVMVGGLSTASGYTRPSQTDSSLPSSNLSYSPKHILTMACNATHSTAFKEGEHPPSTHRGHEQSGDDHLHLQGVLHLWEGKGMQATSNPEWGGLRASGVHGAAGSPALT